MTPVVAHALAWLAAFAVVLVALLAVAGIAACVFSSQTTRAMEAAGMETAESMEPDPIETYTPARTRRVVPPTLFVHARGRMAVPLNPLNPDASYADERMRS